MITFILKRRYLFRSSCSRKILFISKNQDRQISSRQIIIVEYILKLLEALVESLVILGVDDPDYSVKILVVMSPKWPDDILTSNVPNGHFQTRGDVERFNVEADCWDGCYCFLQFQLKKER